jgi:hypothetical protein
MLLAFSTERAKHQQAHSTDWLATVALRPSARPKKSASIGYRTLSAAARRIAGPDIASAKALRLAALSTPEPAAEGQRG